MPPSSFTDLAITQLGQVTVLVVVAALLDRLLAPRTPRLMLAVWLLVAIKAITPPLFASPLGVFSWAQAAAVSPSTPAALPVVSWSPERGPASWILLLIPTFWGIGVVIAGATAWRRWRRLERQLAGDEVPPESDLVRYAKGLAERYNLSPPARVVVSREEYGPAVTGLRRPTLLLPASLIAMNDPATLRPVLLHELVHLNRRDAFLAWTGALVRIVWWFNPLVWWAVRRSELLVERCVDITVTDDLQTSVLEYGRGLLRVLEMRADLHPQTHLAGLRPCQITTDRLNFLRDRQTAGRQGWLFRVASTWCRRGAFVALALTLLPSLPVRALVPTCEPAEAAAATMPEAAKQPL